MTISPLKLGAYSLLLTTQTKPQTSNAFTPLAPCARRCNGLAQTQTLTSARITKDNQYIGHIQEAKRALGKVNLHLSLGSSEPNNGFVSNATLQDQEKPLVEHQAKKSQPHYAQDWQTIRDNPDFHSLMNQAKDGLFFIDKKTVEDIFNGLENQPMLIRTFYQGIDYIDLSSDQRKLLHSIIDLAQLTGSRFEVPQAVIFASPELKSDVLIQKISRSFKGDFTHAIASQFYFNESDQPQVIAVDVSNSIIKAVSEKVKTMAKNPNDCGIVTWFGNFHTVVKNYYDHIQENTKLSPISWQLYSTLYKAFVIESISKDLPSYFKNLLPEDKSINEIVYRAAVAHLNKSNQDKAFYDSYLEKAFLAHNFICDHPIQKTPFDVNQPVYIQYASSASLFIDQDVAIEKAHEFLQQQFPNTYTPSEQDKLIDHVPLGANNQTLVAYRYPLKHLLRAEAEFLLLLLSINTKIQNHAKCFSTLNKLGQAKGEQKEHKLVFDAMLQHYHALMAQEIRSVITDRNTAAALIQHSRFNAFVQDWLSIYTQEVDASMAHYQGKREVLLDRYFPLSASLKT